MSLLSIDNTAIRQIDGLYCVNDLHKATGEHKKHQPSNFFRNDSTITLIEEINRSSDLGVAIKAVQGGTDQGTFVCKELVYAYAMWVSAKFHLHVIRAFDNNLALPAPSNTEKKLAQALLKARPEFNQVSKYLNKQLSVREIALLLQVSRTKVADIKAEMVECGLLTKNTTSSKALTQQEQANIKQLRLKGLSGNKIAKHINRSSSCISAFLRQLAQEV